MNILSLSGAVAAASLIAGAALAQAPMSDMGSPMSASGYVMAAGQSDQFEIQEGRLAQSMGRSPQVKAFGGRMVSDHMKSTKMVMAAAQASGMPPMGPPPLRPDQQQMMASLQATSGQDFDRTYVQQQLQSHQEALQVQQGYAQSGQDANLRRAATKITPVVQNHLAMLQTMQTQMSGQ